ncbi:MAG: class I SAM-dependent methyltransferase [Gammaproteobacteria bacterium]|nr:class I SAM-dependent methyltransferase [Gammaproteobacteria bacterium]
MVDNVLNGNLTNTSRTQRVIEVGVGYGVDFMRIASANSMLELYGFDIKDTGASDNFTFVEGDADNIKYPDNYFDIAVSFGVLEHIQPIEKLAVSVRELSRVSRSFCVVVPAISTIFEPHMASFYWQLRDRNKKPPHPVG